MGGGYCSEMPPASIEEHCQELRDVLKGTVEEALGYVHAPSWEPVTGSEADAELRNAEQGPAGPWGDLPVRTAYALADVGIKAALDQLTALQILTEPITPALGTTVVSRSAVEIGSGVWWLMEPGIGARRRVARCMAEEVESALRADQAATKLGGGSDLQEYLDQKERVRARLDGLGLPITGGGYSPSVDGEERPDATTLTTDCLSQVLGQASAVVYNVYSAVAYGTQYGLMQHYVADPAHPGSLKWTGSRPVMEASVQAALVACLVSVDRIIAVMGWDPTPWNLWKPEVGEAFP